MQGLALGLSPRTEGRRKGGVAPVPPRVTAMLMGQSELEYLFNTAGIYRQIPQAVPGNGNLIVYTQNGPGAAPLRTEVNATTVAAGLVNPAMAALSAFLDHARPGTQFILGDGAVPGTSRNDLSDDSTDATDTRSWADFANVASAIETEAGVVSHLVECWYNADAASINAFRTQFWPVYFGTDGAGASFALGGANGAGRIVNHCLWDGTVAAAAKGRGLFARSQTMWHVLTPMPFHNAPATPSPEMANFSENAARLSEPARATMAGLVSDALAASVNLRVGPSAHLCKFGGSSTQIHPDVGNKDGQVLLVWPVAVALLRAAGMTVNEPSVVAVEAAADGSYADLVVDLPNGGNLTTLAALRGTGYGGAAPHRQAVTGVEITRAGGARRPVYRSAETGYPQAHRGAVTITDSGSGSPRRGRVRITPETPFAYGDALSYLRGQATASLLEPRDFDLYPWFLIEHVPALYNAAATYPFEGIAVRPQQQDLSVPVAAPAFAARAAYFDGGDYYAASSGLSASATTQGLLSVWIRSADTAWNASARRIFQMRVGSSITAELYTASAGRMTLRLNNNTGANLATFYAGPTSSTPFTTGAWYHVMAGWGATGLSVWVNGQQVSSVAFASADMAGQTITQLGIGSTSTGSSAWIGDIGHLWLATSQTLDLSVQANREKFVLAGKPVDLGANGQIPTGSAPKWYYDGIAPAWGNQGTASGVPLTGALTPSAAAPAY